MVDNYVDCSKLGWFSGDMVTFTTMRLELNVTMRLEVKMTPHDR